jgi:hypothetical protein
MCTKACRSRNRVTAASASPPASRVRRSRRLRDTLAAAPGLLAHACVAEAVMMGPKLRHKNGSYSTGMLTSPQASNTYSSTCSRYAGTKSSNTSFPCTQWGHRYILPTETLSIRLLFVPHDAKRQTSYRLDQPTALSQAAASSMAQLKALLPCLQQECQEAVRPKHRQCWETRFPVHITRMKCDYNSEQ